MPHFRYSLHITPPATTSLPIRPGDGMRVRGAGSVRPSLASQLGRACCCAHMPAPFALHPLAHSCSKRYCTSERQRTTWRSEDSSKVQRRADNKQQGLGRCVFEDLDDVGHPKALTFALLPW
eukprot:TRINITY_DN1999_c3_g9_i1.p1 TRINITY_DN1999_c3_g9~~TRINITY_DN1999_c3_g9_i1.p1  ORF type:complete len:122 (+),score=3.65 TRINITY_DN1999_c3_g9_i1:540-905(+)